MATHWYTALRSAVANLPFSLRLIGLYGLVIGSLLFANVLQTTPAQAVSTNQALTNIIASQPAPSIVAKPDLVTGNASQIIIERLGINLPVVPGGYNAVTDRWDLRDDAVHFATMTTPVNNETGHTLLYGHNNRNLLGPTKGIAVGDQLLIKTAEGHTFRYVYTGDTVVDPKATAIVGESSKRPTLTLLTCDGLWFENRRLMHFSFMGVSS